MASFTRGTSFVDGVTGDVTAAKLHALMDAATPVGGLVTDRTAKTSVIGTDVLLIADSADSNNLKKVTVANMANNLPTAKITTGTIETATLGTTTGTMATLIGATITTGTIFTLTAGTTTSTAATITTGTIPTLVATTLITSGTGTAAAPAIVPTGDTNTGVFFPAADAVAIATQGTEAMRIDSNGNVGIGTSTPSSKLDVNGNITANASRIVIGSITDNNNQGFRLSGSGDTTVHQISAFAESLTISQFNGSQWNGRFAINSSGDALVTSAARIGYGSGSGGTVTQGTSKTTGVTLNKPTGQITTSTATLNANTTVSFVLTNSIIASTDTISINHTSGGTGSSYLAWASGISAGSASINLRNITAGNLSDSLVLNFNVIKGATS